MMTTTALAPALRPLSSLPPLRADTIHLPEAPGPEEDPASLDPMPIVRALPPRDPSPGDRLLPCLDYRPAA